MLDVRVHKLGMLSLRVMMPLKVPFEALVPQFFPACLNDVAMTWYNTIEIPAADSSTISLHRFSPLGSCVPENSPAPVASGFHETNKELGCES